MIRVWQCDIGDHVMVVTPAAVRQVHEKAVVVVKPVVVRLLALFGPLPSLLSGFFLLLQHERHLAQHIDRATRLELERMLSGQG